MNDKDIKALKEVIGGLGYMPSRHDLESVGLSALCSKIGRSGGFCFWQKKLNVSPKVRKRKWTSELIKKELTGIADSLGKMPSAQDLKRIGRNDVGAYISKNGGFEYWANQIGRTREHSDSDTGWEGEKKVLEIFLSKGYSCVRSDYNKCPYDLTLNGIVRIDVKSANYAEYGLCKGWFFRLGKDIQSDILILFQLDTNDFYVLPWAICPKTNITISRDGGKYARFKNRFDIIDELIRLRNQEQQIWNA